MFQRLRKMYSLFYSCSFYSYVGWKKLFGPVCFAWWSHNLQYQVQPLFKFVCNTFRGFCILKQQRLFLSLFWVYNSATLLMLSRRVCLKDCTISTIFKWILHPLFSNDDRLSTSHFRGGHSKTAMNTFPYRCGHMKLFFSRLQRTLALGCGVNRILLASHHIVPQVEPLVN